MLRTARPRLRYHKLSDALTEAEKAGLWLGDGCRAIGIAPGQPVATEDLHAALEGYDRRGVFLGLRRDSRRRCGWDVCLSSSKSYSVAALCGPPQLQDACAGAWQDAIRAFVPILETLACRSDGGKRPPLPTGNLIVAAFTHERSRHDDPHRHTHFLVMNSTHDGRSWRALEPVRFYRNGRDLDRAFQRELLAGLRRRNVAAVLDAKGRVQLPFVSEPACRRLSRARRTIERALANPPESMSTLRHEQTKAALLNDRLRPRKKTLDRAKPFDRMLTAAELSALLKQRPTPPKPPPKPADFNVLQTFLRSALSCEPFPTPTRIFAAAIRTATKNLAWPVLRCIDTAQSLASYVRRPAKPVPRAVAARARPVQARPAAVPWADQLAQRQRLAALRQQQQQRAAQQQATTASRSRLVAASKQRASAGARQRTSGPPIAIRAQQRSRSS